MDETSGRQGSDVPNKVSARERLAEQRAQDKRKVRRRRILGLTAAGVIAVAAAGLGVWTLTGSNDDGPGGAKADGGAKAGTTATPESGATGTGTGGGVASDTALPPWPVPADVTAGARAAGLDVGATEGAVKHFHAHLDLIVNGKPVAVPGGIGISAKERLISELHTHDGNGVIHIEAPTADKRYNLGQLFTEWQVGLSANGVGGLRTGGGNTLTAYVNGKQAAGDPAAIELLPHQEIALVYGQADAKVKVPSSYKFPPGE